MGKKRQYKDDYTGDVKSIRQHHKKLRALVSALCVTGIIAAGGATYVLMNPAQTMTKEGIDEMDPNEDFIVADDDVVLEDAFFSAVGGAEIKQGKVDADVCIYGRQNDCWDIEMTLAGTVKVECDRCLGLMDQEIRANESLRVKLGDETYDDGEVITVAANSGELDLAWYLYEAAALAIPIRHVHPEGECDEGVMRHLGSGDRDEVTDPRWHIQKEDSPRLVLSSAELMTRQLLQHWQYVPTVVSSMFITPFALHAATTVVSLPLRRRLDCSSWSIGA